MEKVTDILENTTWEHSLSETSFDSEYFKKELKIFNNINKKNLQALTEIVSKISSSTSNSPTANETGNCLPNRDVHSQFTEITGLLKKYKKIEKKAIDDSSRVDSLKRTEKDIQEEIDRLNEKLGAITNELSELKVDLKKSKKKYKEEVAVLDRGRHIFSAAFNLQIDSKNIGPGVYEKKLKFSSEEEEKYMTLQMNENDSTVSLLDSNFLSKEHLDLLKTYFKENNNITPAICVIRDLYFNDP